MIPLPNERVRHASVVALDSQKNILAETDGYNRVTFEFRCSMGSNANDGVIRIYNLSDGEESAIKRGAKSVRLIAGSEMDHGEIFAGELVDAFSVQDGSSRYLQLAVVDGDSFYGSYVSMSVGAGESLGGLVEKCVSGCSYPLEIGYISPSAYRVKLPRGAVLFGSPTDVLKSIAKSLNAVFYVLKSRFYMVAPGDNPSGAEIQLGEGSGLIGVPVLDSWYASFRHDINSGLSLGRFVSFDQENGGGLYRVVSIGGVGDTKDGDWALSVMAIGQSGSSPNITAVTENIWR